MATGVGSEIEKLRQFLNKECLWVLNSASNQRLKIYTSTTSVSAAFSPHLGGRRRTFMNVTMLILKPRDRGLYVTVYINGVLMACARPEALFTREVPGPHKVYLIYLGMFVDVVDEQVPVESIGSPVITNLHLRTSDIYSSSTPVTSIEDLKGIKKSDIIPLGRGGAWMVSGILYTFFINMDMMMCCPNIPTFPSLTHFVNLLTRCDDTGCISCYGARVHVNVFSGWTGEESPGTSGTCPCLLPCSAMHSEYVPVTGNKNLLGLIFKPEYVKNIVGLRFKHGSLHPDISNVLSGVLATGEEVDCTPKTWTLLRFSTFYSRVMLYNCQVLKKQCLHSY
ncbi:ORF23 [callitrichine gammaherpesvirus 3]|uniref:ORF23 n=1 Tax=callitrichine gammaherpesvirus 3 TaxID=106331 RepID=Q993I7_9GAMA|nr:ORF23 [callitrichine gammaherpesvirus 3]AAK38231.1 ORF23 [callitrichine gammaherpesvirus 3]